MSKLSRGQLFVLRLKYTQAARVRALQTIKPLPNGWFEVQIGGPVRGELKKFPSRDDAEKAVRDHYNAVMMQHTLTLRNRG